MMEDKAERYSAIVVDDEVIVRTILTFALEREGFACDCAADGGEASSLLGNRSYDLVVTDLRMPRKHGHSLALDILATKDRPVFVVHTSIDDPRLAKDLLRRGVDDILYKPTDYAQFAARARILVEQRRANGKGSAGPHDAARRSPLALADVMSKLKHLSTVLPMSKAALDVVELVRDGKHDAQQIAAATARDPSLAVEILKLANSSFYNPAGEQIAEMERAVMRIGLRRVGELAMAKAALTAHTTNVLPWMDVSLAWRRSIAAGLAADVLVGKAGLTIDREGLFLSALMHGLGRVALGTLFPNEYSMMIDVCRETNQPLLELETKVFPESHSETMVRLLEMWNFPSEICEPLKHFLIPYSALRGLDESLRKKVALLKLSVLVGYLAVGQWEPWDLLDLPGDDITASLGLDAVSDVIAQIREDLVQVVHFRKPEAFNGVGRAAGNRERPARVLSYCRVSRCKIDFLPHIAEGMGIVLQSRDLAGGDDGEPVLVNGIGSPAHSLAPYVEDEGGCRFSVLVGENSRMALHRHSANVVALPCSFAALQTAFQLVSAQNENNSPAERLNAAKRDRQSAFHREYDK